MPGRHFATDSEKYIIGLCFVIMLGIVPVVIDLVWARQLAAHLNWMNQELLYKGKTDEYIAELNEHLRGSRSESLRQIYSINMAAAYCDKKDYAQAEKYLTSVNQNKIKGINRAILMADMALVYFYLQDRENFATAYHSIDFSLPVPSQEQRAVFLEVKIMERLFAGEKDEAMEMLRQAKTEFTGERERTSLSDLETESQRFSGLIQ